MLISGIRVVRGPDWIWDDQDGGDGHAGTVCEIGSSEKMVIVNWDSGHRANYRVGYENKFDLTVVDNAQVGVKHSNVICNECFKNDLAGIRFRCAECKDFNICTICYGKNAHYSNHPFIRYQSSNSAGVPVPPRQNSVGTPLKGIYVGAKVVRGPNWIWNDQDGGEGKIGRVFEVNGWEKGSCRSTVSVKWSSGAVNVYRLGFNGFVDLKFVSASIDGCYYKTHMPVLGRNDEQQLPGFPLLQPDVAIGNLIKICVDENTLMKMQESHSGWNPKMRNYMDKIGIVLRITENNGVRVEFEGGIHRWTFHHKVVAKELQIPADKEEMSGQPRVGPKTNQVTDTLDSLSVDDFIAAVQKEKFEFVQEYLRRYPDNIDVMVGGKNAIQVAVCQGHLSLLHYLITVGANLNVVDDEGDSLLHYAAFSNQAEVMQFLLESDLNIDILNAEHYSPLNISLLKKPLNCAKVLIQYGANVNFTDLYDDTPLFVAIDKGNHEVVDLLCCVPNLDLTLKNGRGFNALHQAAFKGNVMAVKRLLLRDPNLVDVKKNDGYTALHLAALGGHIEIVEALVMQGKAEIDIRNNRSQTPFLLAISRGHIITIEKLIEFNCDLRAKDHDGDNAMNLCFIEKRNLSVAVLPKVMTKVMQIYHTILVTKDRLMIALLCYLAQEGCPLEANKDGQHVLDWIIDTKLQNVIKHYQSQPKPVQANFSAQPPISALHTTQLEVCMVCNEYKYLIVFDPCSHQICCEGCSTRMKRCLGCDVIITNRFRVNSAAKVIKTKTFVETDEPENLQAKSMNIGELENTLVELKQKHNCNICCQERERDIVFLCGHGACSVCSESLTICHMCREPIKRKITIY